MIQTYKKLFIIAEATCNHMGQMNIAKDIIETASHFCKADVITFQKRFPKELLTPEKYNASHPNSYSDIWRISRIFGILG